MCTRCARALGRVVAGRFWCSYAWVSLTLTAPVRPRGCVRACTRSSTRLCVRLCVRSSRWWCAVVWRPVVCCGGGVGWCVVVWRGVYAGCACVYAVCRWVVAGCWCAGIPLFSLSLAWCSVVCALVVLCAGGASLFSLSLGARCARCSLVLCIVMCIVMCSSLCFLLSLLLSPLSLGVCSVFTVCAHGGFF